ncbi:unnamed protein product [Cochlearia groenlandica]
MPPDFRGFVFCFIFFGSFTGTILTQEVTLDSIRIYTTHELFSSKPTVYFQCKGENKTVFPDVKRTNVSYSFRGEESWQFFFPLTELNGTKCKRCGIYEEDTFKYDTFDEWELCPSDFTAEGNYTHVKEKEFSASFLCRGCSQVGAGSNKESVAEKEEEEERRGMRPAIVVLIVLLVLCVAVVGLVVGYKYWRKKKRQQEQARFLKLFEDGDDNDDELGLDDTL